MSKIRKEPEQMSLKTFKPKTNPDIYDSLSFLTSLHKIAVKEHKEAVDPKPNIIISSENYTYYICDFAAIRIDEVFLSHGNYCIVKRTKTEIVLADVLIDYNKKYINNIIKNIDTYFSKSEAYNSGIRFMNPDIVICGIYYQSGILIPSDQVAAIINHIDECGYCRDRDPQSVMFRSENKFISEYIERYVWLGGGLKPQDKNFFTKLSR